VGMTKWDLALGMDHDNYWHHILSNMVKSHLTAKFHYHLWLCNSNILTESHHLQLKHFSGNIMKIIVLYTAKGACLTHSNKTNQ